MNTNQTQDTPVQQKTIELTTEEVEALYNLVYTAIEDCEDFVGDEDNDKDDTVATEKWLTQLRTLEQKLVQK